jgi:hypothetical protein
VTRITANVITLKHSLINAEHLRHHATLCFESSYTGFFFKDFDAPQILKVKTLCTHNTALNRRILNTWFDLLVVKQLTF